MSKGAMRRVVLIGGTMMAAMVWAVQPPAEPGAGHDADRATIKPGPVGISAEHTLLGELAGKYDAKITAWASADAKPVEFAGGVVRQSILGGRFLQEQLDASGAPTAFALTTTLGFNPGAKQGGRFELSRLSSAASPMIVERGEFDSANKVFTFTGEYSTLGLLVKSRTVLRLESNENQTLEVFVAFAGTGAETAGVSVPEFKAYSVEYTRRR